MTSPVNSLDPSLSLYDQAADLDPSSRSWESFISSGSLRDPNIYSKNLHPPTKAYSGPPSASDSPLCLSCAIGPTDQALCPHLGHFGDSSFIIQQEIESCVPSLSDTNHPTAESLSPTDTHLCGPTVSPSKRDRSLRMRKFSEVTMPSMAKLDNGTHGVLSARASHSAVERRYRKNLNAQFDKLQSLLLTASTTEDTHHQGGDEADANTATQSSPKTKKSEVLLGAIEYVKRSEWEKQESADAIWFLKQRLVVLEKLVRCEDCALLKQMDVLDLKVGRFE